MVMKKDIFPILYPNAAGIDIASKVHYVAVNPDSDPIPVRSFGAFTEDLFTICQWLIKCNVTTVAMEATGVYWIPLFQLLEENGFEVVLVNAKHVKNVRGKKTDISDAEWIRQLHSCGLLTASFQPDTFTRTLRTYMRQRKNLVQMSATHINIMQKAFEQMNIKLQHVIADITGKSGQAIIRAILQGEHNPGKLVELLDGRIKASKEEVTKSLKGTWKEEHLFEISQSYEAFLFFKQQIQDCDRKIEAHLNSKIIRDDSNHKSSTIRKPPAWSKPKDLSFDATDMLKKILGIDLTEIFGIGASSAVEILSEIGLDMSKWKTEKHFTSWLNLAPNNKKTGGKIISSRTQRRKNKAGQVFKIAAYAIQRSKHWLSSFYHRIKQKAGPGKAVTATARKIAVIFYRMLKDKVAFTPIPLSIYLEMINQKKIVKLTKQAKMLGYKITPAD